MTNYLCPACERPVKKNKVLSGYWNCIPCDKIMQIDELLTGRHKMTRKELRIMIAGSVTLSAPCDTCKCVCSVAQWRPCTECDITNNWKYFVENKEMIKCQEPLEAVRSAEEERSEQKTKQRDLFTFGAQDANG